jgi:two-component system chemotaxis response regulator CheB
MHGGFKLPEKIIRVLIVDDSAFMRRAISSLLEDENDIKVVGQAKDGEDAIKQIEDLRPDVVTMDIEMPKMDGLAALKIIMKKNPLPVIMVSSLTEEGAKATLDALDYGAVDYIPKNLSNVSLNILKVKDDLISKIRAVTANKTIYRIKPSFEKNDNILSQSDSNKTKHTDIIAKKLFSSNLNNNKNNSNIHLEDSLFSNNNGKNKGIVAIGSSTGGPKALQEVIPLLPADFPFPILIVQHMPKAFTGPFAQRLSSISHIKVIEAEGGEIIQPGVAYLAPGDKHMIIKRDGKDGVKIFISEEPKDLINRPSVTVMMKSVADEYREKSIAVMLTGMGSDGLEGMSDIKKYGGSTIAQDEATCVVYGMPKAVIDAGIVDKVLPVYKIAEEIIRESK